MKIDFKINQFVQDLEKKLAGVLRQSFQQCPTIGAQLRLLEVFEGISSRELVQVMISSNFGDTSLGISWIPPKRALLCPMPRPIHFFWIMFKYV